MSCLYCNAPMTLATESRGYKTYRDARGVATIICIKRLSRMR